MQTQPVMGRMTQFMMLRNAQWTMDSIEALGANLKLLVCAVSDRCWNAEELMFQDDGRFIIDIDSNISQLFARLMSASDNDDRTADSAHRYTNTGAYPLHLNVVIMVVGSRGDVQPFVALGDGLRKHGHRVRIATHAVFENFVKSEGLEFYSIGGDPAQLMAYMVKNPGLIPNVKSLQEGEIQMKRRMVHEMIHGCWAACIEPDENGMPFVANAIISNPPTFAHIHCAQALGIPLHLMFTMPWSPTKAFSHPLANIRNTTTDARTANRLSFGLVNTLTWNGLGDLVNEFRIETLGLEEVPLTEGPFLAETLKIPFTYCWSPGLIPKPHDWQDHLDVTGFIFRPPPSYEPSDELDAFLKSGPPPLYVGFGSIVIDQPELLLQTVLKAVALSNVRCIISKGWSSLTMDELPENVMFVGECPHEWLFQRTFAVVHHGGAGTTAAGLYASKPTVIVPFFGDQPFWSSMVARCGAGPAPLPHAKLDAGSLAAAIEYCKTQKARSAAEAVAQKMQSENGVEATIASFYRHLHLESLRCDLIPNLPAVFQYKKSKALDIRRGRKAIGEIKLSGAAADALVKANRIKWKDIRAYKPCPIVIENRRWEFSSALTSVCLGMSYDLLSTVNDLWYAPFKLYCRGKEQALDSEAARDPNKETQTDHARSTARYAGASAMAIPKLLGVLTKGACMDIPLAVTEGLRATPKLHGEAVKDHDPVTDWKSGLKVASKDFISGAGTGLADLVVQPYNGAKEHGARGFATGVAKGALGTVTKTSSAVLGLYAHSAHGVWRSVHEASHPKMKRDVLNAHRMHSSYAAESSECQTSASAIIEAFDKL